MRSGRIVETYSVELRLVREYSARLSRNEQEILREIPRFNIPHFEGMRCIKMSELMKRILSDVGRSIQPC